MSAYRQCMCLLRNTPAIKNFKRCFSVANRTRIYASRLNAIGIIKYPWHSALVTCYSTKKDGSNDIKNLTDEILKSKLASQAKDNQENENTEDKSEDPNKKTKNKFVEAMPWIVLGFVSFTGAFAIWAFGSEETDIDGTPIKDEFSNHNLLIAPVARCFSKAVQYQKEIAEPSRQKLLPDPVEYPYFQPPYTLVLEITDILVHPDWELSTGWRFKKRKGIDYFLSKVGPPLFEVVVFSSENGFTADHIVNNLDPQGYITFRLYRDATRYQKGVHIKDLDNLNRDLSKVIMIDSRKDSVKFHRKNSLLMKPWKGEEDTILYDLGNFLNTVATSGVDDVRTVLEYYQQFDDPMAVFKENLIKLEEQEKQKALEQTKPKMKPILPAWKR